MQGFVGLCKYWASARYLTAPWGAFSYAEYFQLKTKLAVLYTNFVPQCNRYITAGACSALRQLQGQSAA